MVATRLCERESYLEAERMADLRARLNRLEGHVRAINRMLEAGRDCQSLLLQVSAVKSALNQVTVKLLEGTWRAASAEDSPWEPCPGPSSTTPWRWR